MSILFSIALKATWNEELCFYFNIHSFSILYPRVHNFFFHKVSQQPTSKTLNLNTKSTHLGATSSLRTLVTSTNDNSGRYTEYHVILAPLTVALNPLSWRMATISPVRGTGACWIYWHLPLPLYIKPLYS